ncbi:hypothetical protein D3C80_86270 [compost metagenome]
MKPEIDYVFHHVGIPLQDGEQKGALGSRKPVPQVNITCLVINRRSKVTCRTLCLTASEREGV